MTAADLITRARCAGLTLILNGDEVIVRGPTDALHRMLPTLRAHKPALLDALRLEARVRALADRWRLSPRQREAVLARALADPAGWWPLVLDDERWRLHTVQ